MYLSYIILTLFLAEWVRSETEAETQTETETQTGTCPTKYLRFTQNHTFCLEPNPTCQIKVSGLYDEKRDIDRILTHHNTLRSRVALGEEEKAGGLPTASNMMKLIWDDELAELAQKWANNCKFGHDCNECKLVENFPVGQNMVYLEYPCPEGDCIDEFNGKNPEWEKAIDMFYNEVENFDRKDLENFGVWLNLGKIAQFTQMIWANTWRLGCGFVAYQNTTHMRNVYVCNYGPTGNVPNSPIYIPGEPCSNCPSNTCCGKGCKVEESLGGLCKMTKIKQAPIYPSQSEGVLFRCNFTGSEDCKRKANGVKPELRKTLTGNVLYMQLNGSEETELVFHKPITSETNFCFRLTYRRGPAVAGQKDVSKLELSITPKGGFPITMGLNYDIPLTYVPIVFDIPKVEDLKFTLKFSVPEGEPEHILEIKEIAAVSGSCKRE